MRNYIGSPSDCEISMINVDGVLRPIRDSSGMKLAPDQPTLRQFWKWFGDSQLVDNIGRPIPVYHGTNARFDTFNTYGRDLGSHFGSAAQASQFASSETGTIIRAYLKITNMVRLTDRGGFQLFRIGEQLKSEGIWSEADYRQMLSLNLCEVAASVRMQDVIIKAGFDGVIYLNRREGIGPAYEDDFDTFNPNFDDLDFMSDGAFLGRHQDAHDSYIVFDPDQIWLASNVDLSLLDEATIHFHDLVMDVAEDFNVRQILGPLADWIDTPGWVLPRSPNLKMEYANGLCRLVELAFYEDDNPKFETIRRFARNSDLFYCLEPYLSGAHYVIATIERHEKMGGHTRMACV